MEVAGAAQIGVVHDGGGFGGGSCGFVIGPDRCDALAGEPSDLDGAGGYGLDAVTFDVAKQAQNPQACSEALLGMRAAGQDGDDQPLGLWSDRSGPTAEAIRRPFGVSPVGTRHVVGVGPYRR